MSSFRFDCPYCGQHLTGTPEQEGVTAPCPQCGDTVAVPRQRVSSLPPPMAAAPPSPLPPPPESASPPAAEKKGFWTGSKSLLVMVVGAALARGTVSLFKPPDINESELEQAHRRAVLAQIADPPAVAPYRHVRESVGQSVPPWVAAAKPAPRPDWVRREVLGLSLESPYPLEPDGDLTLKSLPAEARGLLDDFIALKGGVGFNPRMGVVRLSYKAGVTVSVDGAASEAARNGARAMGGPNPQFTTTPRMVEGLEACHGKWTGEVAGKKVYAELLFIARGQQMWQVVVMRTDLTGFDVARLFESIRVVER